MSYVKLRLVKNKSIDAWISILESLRSIFMKKYDKDNAKKKIKLSNGSLKEESLLENGVKDDYLQRRKDLVESLFSQGVEDRIVNGIVLFWFGL
ncbi:45969_t:CDS:2 [Gigaspora margarita]|uniref:45969_t:CDS:1 n=1 Tax=Gigaspora margarita TaxID=4874 RepID=A0ABN7W3Z1_GIGMA|nr:45969_t:CDS:2 [Gigaspora margarita]